MTRTEVEDFLTYLHFDAKKIFAYIRPLVPTEYVVFYKDAYSSFKCSKLDSTLALEDLDREGIIKKMMTKEFIYKDIFLSKDNVLKMKTGGCNCGAWIIQDVTAEMHATDCPSRNNIKLPGGYGWSAW